MDMKQSEKKQHVDYHRKVALRKNLIEQAGKLKGAYDLSEIQWIILGQATPVKKATMPKIEWVKDILVACHNAGDIPVFMKNNLQPLLDESTSWQGWKLLQEFPR